MTDRVTISEDDAPTPEPEASDIPDWVDEKFRQEEDPIAAQARAWAEAQQAPEDEEAEEEASEDSDSASDSPAYSTGGDFQVAVDSLRKAVESDSVEDKHFEAFEKLGVPRNFVEQYLAATAQVGQAMANEIYSAAGGQEEYGKMMEWAAKSISREEQEMYNRVMSGDDQALKKKMVSSLYDAFQKNGKPAKKVSGKPKAGQGITPYGSKEELMADMSDPRYGRDPSFLNRVRERLAISNL